MKSISKIKKALKFLLSSHVGSPLQPLLETTKLSSICCAEISSSIASGVMKLSSTDTWDIPSPLPEVNLLLMVQKSCGHQLRLVDYPIIYKVLYIWDGAGFLPSTVRTWNTGVGKTFFHLGRPIFRGICQFLGVSNRKNAPVGI